MKRILVVLVAGVAIAAGSASAVALADPPPSPLAGPPPALIDAMGRDLGLSPQQARQRLADEAAARTVAQRLRPLAGQLTGFWFDAGTGRLVAGVTDDATGAQVSAAGAVPQPVAHGRAELAGLIRAIGARAAALRPAGLAGWGADPRTGTVEVRTHGTGDAFTAWAAALSPAVRIRTDVPVQHQQAGTVRGGDKWTPGTEGACSIGFAATGNGGGRHFLTAGHCTNDANQAAYGKDGSAVGTANSGGTHSVNSREGDFGLVDVTATGWTLSPVVSAWGTAADVTVTGSTEPVTGMSVCRSGQTSGWRCGRVTAVDQSIDYGTVIVDGLFTTDACSQGGDSGGSYVTGTLAVGLHSGGGNPCGQSSPNTTAQPVTEALSKWGLTLTTSGGGTPSPTPSSTPPSTPPTGTRTFSNDTDVAILDNQRVYSPVTATATGPAASPARITVTIRHSCAEDLGISLIGPNGTVYPVRYSGGYSCTPISGQTGYQIPVSGPAAGRWQLRVTDYGYGDTGTLDRWSITL